MRTLAEWVKEGPLTASQAIGWLVRLSRGLLVLHELDVPYGRVSAACVTTSAVDPKARAMLLDADGVRQDFHFYSLDRIERTGASKDDDVWALGVLLYHLVTGGYPFSGDSRRKVGERIKWMPASPIEVYEVDHAGMQRLLDRLFKPDEGMRLASLPLLIDALVSLDPTTDGLPPLELEVEVGAAPSARKPEPAPPKKKPAPEATPSPSVKPAAQRDVATKPAEPASSAKKPAPEPAPSAKKPAPAPTTKPAPTIKPAPATPAPATPAPATKPVPAAATASAEAPPELPVRGNTRGDTEKPTLPVSPSDEIDESASTSRAAPPLTGRPAPAKRAAFGWLWILLGAAFGIGVVVYVQLLMNPAPSALPATASPASSAPAPAPASAEPPASPSAGPSAAVSAASSASAPRDASACVREMFPADAFGDSKPALDVVCTGADPVSLAEKLRGNVVEGKPQPGVITSAMRLWSEMGWFRMAFVSAARQRCCEGAPTFETELGGPPCGLDSSLDELGSAAVRGDNEQFRVALARYITSVRCMSSAPTSAIYGLNAPAEDGQLSAFRVAATNFRPLTP